LENKTNSQLEKDFMQCVLCSQLI